MINSSGVLTIIVGDLIQSRRIYQRSALPPKIQSAITKTNREFREELYAPLTMTRGIDELSGVLKLCRKSYRICRYLNDEIHPYQFRFVVAMGPLDVALESRDARRMDGAAFHRGADLMRRAKDEDRLFMFDLGYTNKEGGRFLNTVPDLVGLLRHRWTAPQRLIADLYSELRNETAVGNELGISQQAVSEALIRAQWKRVTRAERMIDEALDAISEESRRAS